MDNAIIQIGNGQSIRAIGTKKPSIPLSSSWFT